MKLHKLVWLLLSLGKHHQGHIPGEGEGEDQHQETRQTVTRSVSFLSKANLAVNGQKIIPPPSNHTEEHGTVVHNKSGLLSAARSASGALVKAGKVASPTCSTQQGLECDGNVVRIIQRRDAEQLPRQPLPPSFPQQDGEMLLLDLS
ncbi:hypothetical protein BASA81_016252 [Batrachochytrium salamandrivorans]|nr:hypothetical protein BASA81_016252 [Batrachochytrium salamandrivorans]